MTATSSPTTTPPSKNVFRLHGVNVLNRKNIDSISRLTALEKRRATHILDERQRRDTMNQLLGELANLVRESAEAEQQQQQQQQQQQKQYNTDGSEKRPPVKSNSITTLRSAINEIRRLRSCVGLETVTPPCAASLAVSSPNASRSSSPMDMSTSSHTKQPQLQQYQQQQHLLPSQAPNAPQYGAPNSRHSTPMAQAPHHQLQSPPLSPSSPKHRLYSSVSPPMMPVHHQSNQAPSLPSLFAPNSPDANQYYQQPQPNQHYHHQPVYKTQYGSSQHEFPQHHGRPLSPGLSGPMLLPQPYIQHPSSYQSSPSYAQV
ncbi:hypothetical protein BGX27_008340 [Mortierella sp. AM989]|nr:hypothetical protein BGX27_008340 [Mortierella sp. AM989]